jgi:hypothetical protein
MPSPDWLGAPGTVARPCLATDFCNLSLALSLAPHRQLLLLVHLMTCIGNRSQATVLCAVSSSLRCTMHCQHDSMIRLKHPEEFNVHRRLLTQLGEVRTVWIIRPLHMSLLAAYIKRPLRHPPVISCLPTSWMVRPVAMQGLQAAVQAVPSTGRGST